MTGCASCRRQGEGGAGERRATPEGQAAAGHGGVRVALHPRHRLLAAALRNTLRQGQRDAVFLQEHDALPRACAAWGRADRVGSQAGRCDVESRECQSLP